MSIKVGLSDGGRGSVGMGKGKPVWGEVSMIKVHYRYIYEESTMKPMKYCFQIVFGGGR
jgi:hypothetical protein